VTVGKAPRVTWSRLGITLSIGLVVFGVIEASLPYPTLPSASVPGLGPQTRPDPHVASTRSKTGTAVPLRSVPLQAQADAAAQSVAERFVVATDTTDPTHPEGDAGERALLAPGLTVPRQLAWPEAWVAENRRTTMVLDPPGPAVGVGAGQVTVVLTGRMVVTTVAGPSTEVPVDERVTLHLITPWLIGPTGSAPHWVVTNVGTGS
jgi:hypothetical protein